MIHDKRRTYIRHIHDNPIKNKDVFRCRLCRKERVMNMQIENKDICVLCNGGVDY